MQVEEYLIGCFVRSVPPRAKDLAAAVGLSAGRFSNIFLQQFGERPAIYLKRRQVERAKALLRTTDYSISTVARASGFGTRMTLFRAFRRFTGMTPMEYRRQGVAA